MTEDAIATLLAQLAAVRPDLEASLETILVKLARDIDALRKGLS